MENRWSLFPGDSKTEEITMGAWGTGNFENDTALDWVYDLEKSSNLSSVEICIANVLNCGDYLDADVSCTGLAAAEVVAALRNRPMDDLPEAVSQWVETHKIVPSDKLVKDSLAAIDKIRNNEKSELKELMEETEDLAMEWYSILDNLAVRLQ
jgi:hypothetical protein